MNLEKMDRLIDAWRDEIFERLKGWIAIPSVNAPRSAENAPFGEQVRRMLDLFLSDARALGFEAEEFDGYCAHALLGRGERNMGILAHLDVVPAGDGWTTPPFEGVLKDGRFYGRGAMDDKGPAMAALYAMRAVREAGIALRDGVRLIVGCDEETGMTDMRHYAQVASLPDYGFSPDAEYPLINIEKGGLNLELSAAAPCDEKSALPVYEVWAGERVNVVPGVASALVGTDDVPALNARLEQIARAHENFSLCAKEEGCGRLRPRAHYRYGRGRARVHAASGRQRGRYAAHRAERTGRGRRIFPRRGRRAGPETGHGARRDQAGHTHKRFAQRRAYLQSGHFAL